jgi:hypothetical protein
MPYHDPMHPAAPQLPPPPREPDLDECCASGCDPCVFDLYEDRLQRWEARCKAILAAQQNTQDDRSRP